MKYKNEERIAEEDAELARLEEEYRKQNSGETQAHTPEDNDLSEDEKKLQATEEQTWKKRYSDLRSYTQKQVNDVNKELAELKKQLAEKEKEAKFPVNKQEAEEWVKEYPDLARVIGTLIEERAGTLVTSVADEVKTARLELEAERSAVARERAVAEVLKVHPDFLDLIQSDDFKEWVENQPKVRGPFLGQSIYNALYENDTDANSAIQAVNVYKQDKGMKKSKKETSIDAAYSVKKTAASTPIETNGKRVFHESEIEKMSSWDFDKLEEEIEAARREGRIVYDISGAAR